MLVTVHNVLTKDELVSIRKLLDGARFSDGRLSAGLTARKVKKNEELPASDQLHQQLNHIVMNRLLQHPVFQSAVLPHRVATPFYARYTEGMEYGNHVDDPVMGPMNARYRTDVSMTLFLNEPDEYDGGETVIHTQTGEQKIKLKAGDAVTYPSGSLHHVAKVTRGTRLVAVSWIQSMIRDPAQRELLFNLHKTRENLQKKYPDDEEVVKIDHAYINLVRMWSEI